MKKSAIVLALATFVTGAAQATTLNITAGNAAGTINCTTGSCFGMEVQPGLTIFTNISGFNGLILGTSQAASGTHTGAPNGSEIRGIDNAWNFFGNTGLHYTNSPTNILSQAGNAMTVDMSGWGVTWNGIAAINMGSGGSASVVCGVNCANGDTYTLTYNARVPLGDASGFGGVAYSLALRGTVSAVPVPAAAWLLGSGLVGLVGMARRKTA